VVIYLVVSGGILLGGVLWDRVAGLYLALAAVTVGRLIQTLWLWRRSRSAVKGVERRDEDVVPLQAADITAR
jgi:hypothetical protein